MSYLILCASNSPSKLEKEKKLSLSGISAYIGTHNRDLNTISRSHIFRTDY